MKTNRAERFKPVKRNARRKPARSAKRLPPTHYELFKEFIGIVKDAPADLAKNHDHYAHGAPKRFK